MAGGNRREEDYGEIPWPALVDLLTSVLIVFVFFILVVTIAMSTMTMKSEKNKQVKDQESVEKTATTDSSQTILEPPSAAVEAPTAPELEAENQRLKNELEMIQKQMAAQGDNFVKSKEIKIIPNKSDQSLLVIFERYEAGTLPEVNDKIRAYVQQYGQKRTYSIISGLPRGLAVLKSRELALTRGMIIRNILIENGVAPDKIYFKYDQRLKMRENTDDWVLLQKDGEKK